MLRRRSSEGDGALVWVDRPREPLLSCLAHFSGWIRSTQSSASLFTFKVNGVEQAHVNFHVRPDVPPAKGKSVHGWSLFCEVDKEKTNEHGAVLLELLDGDCSICKRYFRLRAKADQEPKIFVIHMPKTAGTSLRAAIEHAYKDSEALFVYENEPMYFKTSNCLSLSSQALDDVKMIYGHFGYGMHRHTTHAYKYITFLREPYEFIKSYLFFVKHVLKNPDFSDILDVLHNRKSVELDNCYTRYLCNRFDEAPVTESDLTVAIENLKRDFAFVGLVERMRESVDALSAYVGREISVGQLNKTPDIAERRLIDDRALREAAARNILYDSKIYEFVLDYFWNGAPTARI